LPIDVARHGFQEAVWRELRKIPPGETRSYARSPRRSASRRRSAPCGTANGDHHRCRADPVPPRIRSDGTLGGYAGGLDRKKMLLDAEGHSAASPELPLVD
jgi:AraC family transcriptional regulator of adaptative response/methylated-DNA-[protein]-cysteine methyltransferase